MNIYYQNVFYKETIYFKARCSHFPPSFFLIQLNGIFYMNSYGHNDCVKFTFNY